MVSGEFKRGVVIAPPCLLGNTKVLMYCSMLSKHKPSSRKIALFVYRIAGIFEGENFHEFHESIAIRENFTLKIFTKSIRHCVLLMRFVKIFPLEKLD